MPPKLKCVVRYDSVPLGQTYFTEEGYLVDRPVLTSTGIFEYSNDDGSIRRELRLPEEVFAPESLKTYKGKPIIITHDAGLITKDNVHEESVGTILSEGYKSGKDVRAEIIIHDTDEMREAGLKELSLGYNLELDETPGVWKGQPYDAVQRNITINHLALVLEARAGEQARLNIDSRNGKSKGARTTMSTTRKKTRKTGARRVQKKVRRVDGVLSPEELEAAIKAYKERQAKRGKPPQKKDAEDEPAFPDKKKKGAVPPVTDEDDTEEFPAPVKSDSDDPEEQVQFVKDRRDRRDEEGDPGSKKEAMGIIAQQDDDIDMLFDIIDSLLAERDFAKDADDEEKEAAVVMDDEEEEEVVMDDDDEEEFVEDDDEEEEFAEDDDDEEFCEDDDEDEEFAEDDDEEEEFVEDDEDEEDLELNTDDDDDEIPNTQKSDVTSSGLREPQIKTDSIDRIVRQRVQINMAAQALHMDGLENMKLMPAKKAIIRAVRPGLRLDGKSRAYINAAFDCAVNDVMARQRKTTKYQKKQMFNKDSKTAKRRSTGGGSSQDARARMIRRQTNQKKGVK